MKAYLALEDGIVFSGQSLGAIKEQWGEVVFNTGMTGYQEILTDPSYSGQIIVLTYPLIGNYGLHKDNYESWKSFARGLVVREVCDLPSNWRAGYRLSEFLIREGVPGICGLDTRALTKRLRSHGTMRGIIAFGEINAAELAAKARACPSLSGQRLAIEAAVKELYTIESPSGSAGKRVVLIDLGVKFNIIRKLQARDCTVIVVPPDITPQEIVALDPDRILVSNGPGDPEDVPETIATVRVMADKKYPMLGICLGEQIMALALGAKTYKMKFGHRGSNHPVKDLRTGRVYITSHNHGFSVEEASLSGLDIEVSHINLNDQTVEGIRHKYLPFFGVQYHPEASPGPQESDYIFDQFMALMCREGA